MRREPQRQGHQKVSKWGTKNREFKFALMKGMCSFKRGDDIVHLKLFKILSRTKFHLNFLSICRAKSNSVISKVLFCPFREDLAGQLDL